MKKISIEKGKFTDQNNNLVTVWHEIQFEGSLTSFKKLYGSKHLTKIALAKRSDKAFIFLPLFCCLNRAGTTKLIKKYQPDTTIL